MRKVNFQEVAGETVNAIAFNGAELQGIEFIVGISRGGLFPAMVAATSMVKPLVAVYIDKQDNVYFDRDEWIKGKKVLLVDDIVRTGKTITKIRELLYTKGALSVQTLTPYYLEGESMFPDYGMLTAEDIEFPWDE